MPPPPMPYEDKAHWLIAYAFSLILVRVNNMQCFVAYLLCFKMIRNIPQGVWFSVHCLITHLFCLKTV